MAQNGSIPPTLPADVVWRLANLAGEPDDVVEVALSTCRTQTLDLLAGEGIIEPIDGDGNEDGYGVAPIVLTRHGRAVIEACAGRAGAGDAPIAVPPTLNDHLVDRLAALTDEPDDVAEVALSALGYGSLACLMAHDAIAEIDIKAEVPTPIFLTARGRELIDACARLRRDEEAAEQEELVVELPPLSASISSVDSAVLRQDSASTAMEVGTVAEFDGLPPSYPELLAYVEARLGAIPRFRQKLVSPLGGLGDLSGLVRERWLDDAAFDMEYHVRHVALPAPGDGAELERLVGRIFSEHLDHSRPLWGLWLVSGLEDGGFALVAKSHHVLLEGISGVDLLTLLYDPTRTPRELRVESDWDPPARERSTTGLAVASVTEAVRSAFALPFRLAGVMTEAVVPTRTAPQLLNVVRQVTAAGLNPAPPSPLGVAIGAQRRVAFTDVDLDALKAVRHATGATVNDVVLAAVAGGLRHWLLEREEEVDGLELKATSVTTQGKGTGPLSAQITQTIVPLAVGEENPVERLRRVCNATRKRDSGNGSRVDNKGLMALPDLMGTTVVAQVLRLALSSRLYNLMVGTLRGSSLPLYLLGRRMRALRPVAFLAGDQALAVGVMSYDDRTHFGLIADYDALPDIHDVVDGLQLAVDELVEATGASAAGNGRQRRPSTLATR